MGCGEGVTARILRSRVDHVTGIDAHQPSIDDAREQGGDVEYVVGSFLSHHFEPRSFDVVSAVAVLHHVDLVQGLERLAELVAPGGVLLVVGFARFRSPIDYAYAAVGTVWMRRYLWTRGQWETPSPKLWDFTQSFAEVRRTAQRVLPGARFRRDPFFRYSLVWVSPGA